MSTDDTIDEISAMGGGAVQGFGAPLTRKRKRVFKENEIQYIDRAAFLEELQLREHIRESIQTLYAQDLSETTQKEGLVRKLIKQIIQEEQRDIDDSPHHSTGINMLEDLLKKIVPILEDAYKTLTTKDEQRTSFRSHILNAVAKTLAQADITGQAGIPLDADDMDTNVDALAEQIENLFIEEDEEEDLTVTVGDEDEESLDNPEDSEKFIDIKDKKPSQEKDTFGLPGEDETGRNVAEMTYDKIEKNILDSYTVLGDDEDKVLFYDYLLTNLKLYFDKFESELSPSGIEPTAGTEDSEAEEDLGELPDENIV